MMEEEKKRKYYYEKGYDAAEKDLQDEKKAKLYIDGYKEGFKEGYKAAIEDMKRMGGILPPVPPKEGEEPLYGRGGW